MKIIKCAECGARCCRDVAIEMDAPEDFEDFEIIKWLIEHKNVKVYLDNDNAWLAEFSTDCKHIGKDGKCKIYDERFKVCREHDPEGCIVNGDGDHFKVIFKTCDDVDRYMKKKGFYEKYMKEREKMKKKNP